MMGLINFMDLKKGFRILAVMLTLYVPFMAQVQAADVVGTSDSDSGARRPERVNSGIRGRWGRPESGSR